MNDILHQLGGLFLGSVPTIIFFLLLLAAYGVLVRRPLDRVLAERRSRTSGAMEQARGAIGAAEAETAVFEDKLRTARAELFAARTERLKRLAEERDRALAETRTVAGERLRVAREGIEASTGSARGEIERVSGELSERVLRAVLPANVAAAATGEPGSPR